MIEVLPSYLALVFENRRLRRQLVQLQRQSVILPNAKTVPPSAYAAKSYFSFFLQTIKRRFIYRAWRTVRGIFRPTFFVARVLRILGLVLTFLQASAAAIVFSALAIVLLPALFVLSLAFLAAGTGANRRAVRGLLEEAAGRRVLFVFVLNAVTPTYQALAAEYGGLVLFVCEEPKRASGKRMRFPMACYPLENGYLITQRCYFRLRRYLSGEQTAGLVF